MGSKTNCTIARDFEMLTEDAEPENAARAGTLPMCRGGLCVPGGPVTALCAGAPAETPESRVKGWEGVPRDAGRVSRSRAIPANPRSTLLDLVFKVKFPFSSPESRRAYISLRVCTVTTSKKNHARLPRQTLRDGVRLRNPEPVGDFGSVARWSLPLRGSKHRPSGLATSGPSGQRAAGHRRL